VERLNRLFSYVRNLGHEYPDHYGLYNTKEFVAEAMSNPVFQKFLMGLDAPKGWGIKSVWEGFKNAVREVLGITPTTRSVFDALMDTAHGLFAENENPVDASMPAMAQSGIIDGMHALAQGADAINRRTFDELNASVSDKLAGKALNWSEKIRKQVLGWTTSGHIAQVFGTTIACARIPSPSTRSRRS
jgi:hypothetical protein